MPVIVTNQGFTTRTSRTGKQRVTIDVQSEPLVHNLDPRELGAGPAEALAELIRSDIAGISAQASPATIAARQRAARAFSGAVDPKRGKRSGSVGVNRRYAGGRTGALPPNQSDRLFNDSGRLVKSIVARAVKDGLYVINVAANRFDTQTLSPGPHGSSQGALDFILTKLKEHVRFFAEPKSINDDLRWRRALKDAAAGMIQKQRARIDELKEQRARAVLRLVGLG